ncbi:MAG: hypothetical protein JST54_26300 [Deltaproteobacteria bacterium]|nr:hypothetical protein [Deltaproteobacteria bacterium]
MKLARPRFLDDDHVRKAALPFLVSRILVWAVAFIGLEIWPALNSPIGVRPLRSPGYIVRAFPDFLPIDGLIRCDSAWYWSIVDPGYFLHRGAQSNIAFFPLYSYLSALMALPWRLVLAPDRAFYVGGLIVSNVAFGFALVAIHRLSSRWTTDPSAATRACWLVALYPFSYFFSCVYTESLFLALSTWSVLSAYEGRWLRAAVFAMFVAVTRNIGIALLPILGLIYLREIRFDPRRIRRDAFAFLLTPLLLCCFLYFNWTAFGTPLAFASIQGAPGWGRSFGFSYLWRDIHYATDPRVPFYDRVVNATHMLLVPLNGIATVLAIFTIPAEMVLYSVGSTLPFLGSGTYVSSGRYASVLFPLFIAAGIRLKRAPLIGAALVLFTALLIYLTNGYAHWFGPV